MCKRQLLASLSAHSTWAANGLTDRKASHVDKQKKTKVKEETQKGKWKAAEASGYWWRDSLFIWCELRTSAGWFTLLSTSMIGQETEDVWCSCSQPFCLFDNPAGIGPLNAELFANSFHHITSGRDLFTWCQNEPFQPVIKASKKGWELHCLAKKVTTWI